VEKIKATPGKVGWEQSRRMKVKCGDRRNLLKRKVWDGEGEAKGSMYSYFGEGSKVHGERILARRRRTQLQLILQIGVGGRKKENAQAQNCQGLKN